jgi:SAM-dependent methyltransferase
MTQLAEWSAEQAELWGSGEWQRIAESELFPVHDDLVVRLAPHPGERWLDAGTGTGAVALRAARAGAQVTAQDLSPALIETARRLAAEQGLELRFDVGSAERLPYPDASFDVVSSAHGVVFAADHRAMAREVARVCRPGGRLGLTHWLPNPGLERLMERFGYERPAGTGRPGDWGRPEYASELLGEDFELSISQGVCPWTGESGEAVWELTVGSDGVARTAVATMAPAEREALRGDWIDYFERHRAAGGVSVPRPYFVLLGRRR